MSKFGKDLIESLTDAVAHARGEGKPKQYRSPIMAAIHETAEDLHAVGLMDKHTMRKFDEACLTPAKKHD